MISLFKEMGFVVIPVVSVFLYLPLILKIFFFHDLNFDFKGLKTTHRLNRFLNILSEVFLVILIALMSYSAILTYDVKNKDNIQNMFPFALIALSVMAYFVASGMINKWLVLVGPVLGSLLVWMFYTVMKGLKLA